METANSTLCTSRATKISRAELLSIATPPRTLSFMPVPHAMLIDLIETRLHERAITITKAEFAVQNSGMKLFCTMTLQHQTRQDFSFALALRASNDKSLPIKLIAGVRIFVCDNGAFSGDTELLCRKHTSRLNPREEIFTGVDKAITKFNTLDTRILQLKASNLADVEAKALMLDAALTGVMPLRMLPDVNKEYFEPRFAELQPGNMWSLHNAFTYTFKELRPNVALKATQALGVMFQM